MIPDRKSSHPTSFASLGRPQRKHVELFIPTHILSPLTLHPTPEIKKQVLTFVVSPSLACRADAGDLVAATCHPGC